MELVIYGNRPDITWVNYKFIEQRIDAQYYKNEFIENEIKIKQINNLPLKGLYTRGDYGTLPDSADYSEKGIYLIRGTDLRDLSIKEDDFILVPEEYFSDKNEVKSEDILILIKGATIDAEWSVSIVPKINYKAIFNGSIFRIRLKKEYDPYFVTAFMSTKYFLNQKKRAISNTGIYYNDKDSIENFIIPIPSPEIQKYIGDKVRKAEELREEAKRLKKEAEDLLYEVIELKPSQELDKDMFSFVKGNYINSERLDSEYYKTEYIALEKLLKTKKVICLKDILIESKYGASVEADYAKVGIPFIRGNNLTDNEINMDDIVCLNKKLKDEVKNHIVNTGDILITRSGTVGISAVVDEKCDGFSFGSFMIKLGIDTRLWNPYYIAAFLNSYWGKWQIVRLQNGAVQQNINMQEIGRIMIPIVTKENQDNIEESIKNYINQKRQSKQLIQEAKQDVEDLIEGNFDMSKIKVNN